MNTETLPNSGPNDGTVFDQFADLRGRILHVYRIRQDGKPAHCGQIEIAEWDPGAFSARFGPGDYQIKVMKRGERGIQGIIPWAVDPPNLGASPAAGGGISAEVRLLLERAEAREERMMDLIKSIAVRPAADAGAVNVVDLLKIVTGTMAQRTPAAEMLELAKLAKLFNGGGGDGGGENSSALAAGVNALLAGLAGAGTPPAPPVVPRRPIANRNRPVDRSGGVPGPRLAPRDLGTPPPPPEASNGVGVDSESPQWVDLVRAIIVDPSVSAAVGGERIVAALDRTQLEKLLADLPDGQLTRLVLQYAPDLGMHSARVFDLEMAIRDLLEGDDDGGPDTDDEAPGTPRVRSDVDTPT